MSDNSAKDARYRKLFNDIIKGKQKLIPSNANLFIEAICAESDPVATAQRLRDSPEGLTRLQECLRFDLSNKFLNGHGSRVTKYISNDKLVDVESGMLLQAVLRTMVEPPLFWEAFQKAFRNKGLQEDAELSFSFLLLRLLSSDSKSYLNLAKEPDIIDPLLKHSHPDVRAVACRIKHIIDVSSTGEIFIPGEYVPGGRHDNDFTDFHDISILPTADEIRSKDFPFIRPSSMLTDRETEKNRVGLHMDNQFRLLREDLLYEMREELDIAFGESKKKHRGFKIDGLEIFNIFTSRKYGKSGDDGEKPCLWCISLKCLQDPWPSHKTPASRKKYLQDNPNILRHQSMACLSIDKQIIAFPSVYRDEDLLLRNPPVIVLQLPDSNSVKNVLTTFHNIKHNKLKNVQLLQINTAIFAYEPVLQALQQKLAFPLADEILFWSNGRPIELDSKDSPQAIIRTLHANPQMNLRKILKSKKSIILDEAQHQSLLSGLQQRVSLIQGPPGTGKSFIGALLGKIIHDYTQRTVLVICYTNHALDQFLEDLMDIGIPSEAIVRLGSKSSQRTEPLSLQKQKLVSRFQTLDFSWLNELRLRSQVQMSFLKKVWEQYRTLNPSGKLDLVLEHLLFEYPEFSDAFSIPESEDGMKLVGKDGKSVAADYLLRRWKTGKDAGQFSQEPTVWNAAEIWHMTLAQRKVVFEKWERELLDQVIEDFLKEAGEYNDLIRQIDDTYGERDSVIINSKRIIGCTTTAAAKYRKAIEHAHPDVVLVEEAGEILESHVLTAMGGRTTQLILIGDHKQLRPKVNNYHLTVEKGEGFDLNRSLFERLVLSGYPHTTLKVQHRMRPEISQLVRKLDVYPELQDASTTISRPNVRGLQSNVIFINHEEQEDDEPAISERRDPTMKSSKRNTFEANMVLKIVRYLAQQGYSSDQLVVLTPYLGQLRNLREILKTENDPVLNDLDTYELVQAGLMTAASAKLSRKPLRLATIDNYQGEESDIVIVSLTRSNAKCDIGFMRSAERLTVLLSRARDALIMIGNMNTFMKSRDSGESWSKLFKVLAENDYLFDGFPVKCEKHPTRTALITSPKDFDTECPNGGCTEPCFAILSCGLHKCPSKCHQILDHSKMACNFKLYNDCPKGHRLQYLCFKGIPLTCNRCEKEAKEKERRKNEEFLHAQKLAAIDEKMKKARELEQDEKLAKERQDALEQKEKDLKKLMDKEAQPSPSIPIACDLGAVPSSQKDRTRPKAPQEKQEVIPPLFSPSRDIWERRKQVEGVSNSAVDGIMDLSGLEEVKKQVLRVMDKIDTIARQGSDLKGERFNVAMLGNPGTGKTTVARFYAKFLASVNAIPSETFVETTGSRLCLDGADKVKKQIDGMLSSGGGTFFIDEAYQLVSPNNAGGNQILDFLLAEMENHLGKLVFIFAGYNKEMEKFFEHNPGLNSRVPYRLQFNDYTDEILLDMLDKLVQKKWEKKMVAEGGGVGGLYGRIAVRRLGRGRNTPGFGNARALANLLSRISERQAERISAQRRMGKFPDDFLLAKEDLIGPEPASVMIDSPAWKELQSMIGLSKIKESVRSMFSLLQTNYDRELLEKKPHDICLNRAFLGSPGTGKTTVAKLYGQILVELGMLSNGEVVVKNPADFIGAHLGQSESQTKAILANTVGKVLVIDEAYMLHGSGAASGTDIYKTAVIDTLVAEVQNVPGEDRCVLLLGYKDQMEEMFQNVNPGLARRFSIENAFIFEDYSDSELLTALEFKLKKQDLTATEAAKTVAMEVLSRMRNRPNFGNIGEVENLLSQAKLRFQARQMNSNTAGRKAAIAPFEPVDFDPDYNRNENARTNLTTLFDGVVGAEPIIQKLDKWQTMATNLKKLGIERRNVIPTTFVFKGPPGTGKTTTARKIGHVYYDMGFLASSEVVECSASDLVGQYVGQTGPKTKQLFEKALGRVLFIDEAYRLREGQFAHEAVDELVGLLTQDRYRGKLIVILAGYDQEINDLLALNPGLSSRFPEEIVFASFSADHCLQILRNQLKPKKIRVAALEQPDSSVYREMMEIVEKMIMLPSWGNARDIETLAKQIAAAVFSTPIPDSGQPNLTLSDEGALECFRSMCKTKQERESNMPAPSSRCIPPGQVQQLPNPTLSPISVTSSTSATKQPPKPRPKAKQQADTEKDQRDEGVPDDVWQQLQIDKEEQNRRERETEEAIKAAEQAVNEAEEVTKEAEKASERLQAMVAQDKSKEKELLRLREQAKLKELEARVRQAELENERARVEEGRRREARTQAKLRMMGVCVAGYRWIKQAGGYRCEGGVHFVSDDQLK